jgi:hypothetical protein
VEVTLKKGAAADSAERALRRVSSLGLAPSWRNSRGQERGGVQHAPPGSMWGEGALVV